MRDRQKERQKRNYKKKERQIEEKINILLKARQIDKGKKYMK